MPQYKDTADPLEGLPERLERVRGSLSLRRFVEILTKQSSHSLTHESVRRYHQGGTVPAWYIAEVARVFGVSPAWLLIGRGPMWLPETEGDPPLGPWQLGTPAIRGVYTELLERILEACPDPVEPTTRELEDLASLIMDHGTKILELIPGESRPSRTLRGFVDFTLAYLELVMMTVPEAMAGRSVSEILKANEEEDDG